MDCQNVAGSWELNFMFTGLLRYSTRHFITLLNIRWDANSWIRVTHEIHKHFSPSINDDFTVSCFSIG